MKRRELVKLFRQLAPGIDPAPLTKKQLRAVIRHQLAHIAYVLSCPTTDDEPSTDTTMSGEDRARVLHILSHIPLEVTPCR